MKRFSKTRLFCSLFVIFCADAWAQTPYVISYHLPSKIQNQIGGIPFYYKGFKIDFNEEKAAVLPESGVPLLFHLMVIKQVCPKESHNNIVCWECPEKEPCILYELRLSITRNDLGEIENYHWDITPFPQERIPKRLPENALLVLFDPNLVEKLSDDPTTHTPGSITLPMINFKNKDKKIYEEAFVFAAVAALDIDHFNRREHAVKVPHRNNIIVIPTQGYE